MAQRVLIWARELRTKDFRVEGKLAVTALGGSLCMSAQRSIYQLQNQCVTQHPSACSYGPWGCHNLRCLHLSPCPCMACSVHAHVPTLTPDMVIPSLSPLLSQAVNVACRSFDASMRGLQVCELLQDRLFRQAKGCAAMR